MRPRGLEPLTCGLGNRRSILLSYERSHETLPLHLTPTSAGYKAPAYTIDDLAYTLARMSEQDSDKPTHGPDSDKPKSERDSDKPMGEQGSDTPAGQHDPDKSAGQPEQGPAPKRARRKRYAGTYPRRFEQRYKELDPQAHPDTIQQVRSHGRTPAGSHVPIMVDEVMTALAVGPGQVVADCTLGYGGHAERFLKLLGPSGKLIGLDVDGGQLQRTVERLKFAGFEMIARHSNFAGLAKVMGELGVAGVDVIFADLGVSSMQVDEPARGFSYKQDGPLDMRMDARIKLSAADHLARLSEAELSQLLWELADEEDHAAIARTIVLRRGRSPILRTHELTRLIFQAKGIDPAKHKQAVAKGEVAPHPAARTFQALRILVNNELASLRELLRVAPECLLPGGKIECTVRRNGAAELWTLTEDAGTWEKR